MKKKTKRNYSRVIETRTTKKELGTGTQKGISQNEHPKYILRFHLHFKRLQRRVKRFERKLRGKCIVRNQREEKRFTGRRWRNKQNKKTKGGIRREFEWWEDWNKKKGKWKMNGFENLEGKVNMSGDDLYMRKTGEMKERRQSWRYNSLPLLQVRSVTFFMT